MAHSTATWTARVLGLAPSTVIVAFGILPGVWGVIDHPEAKTPMAFYLTLGLLTAAALGYLAAWFVQRTGAFVLLLSVGSLLATNLLLGRFRYMWFGDLAVEIPSLILAALALSAGLFLYGAGRTSLRRA